MYFGLPSYRLCGCGCVEDMIYVTRISRFLFHRQHQSGPGIIVPPFAVFVIKGKAGILEILDIFFQVDEREAFLGQIEVSCDEYRQAFCDSCRFLCNHFGGSKFGRLASGRKVQVHNAEFLLGLLVVENSPDHRFVGVLTVAP